MQRLLLIFRNKKPSLPVSRRLRWWVCAASAPPYFVFVPILAGGNDAIVLPLYIMAALTYSLVIVGHLLAAFAVQANRIMQLTPKKWDGTLRRLGLVGILTVPLLAALLFFILLFMHGNNFIWLAASLAIGQLISAWQMRTNRDVRYNLGRALIIMLIATSADPTYPICVIAYLIAAVGTLVVAHITEQDGFRPRTAVGLSQAAPKTRLTHLFAAIAAISILVALIGYLLLPQFPLNQFLSSLQQGSQGRAGNGSGQNYSGYFGFDPNFDLHGKPSNSEQVMMEVRSNGWSYWRGRVYNTYTGSGWRSNDTDPMPAEDADVYDHDTFTRLPTPGDSPALPSRGDDPCAARCLTQTYTYKALQPNILFSAYSPYDVYYPSYDTYIGDYGTIYSGRDLPPGTTYSVVSQIPDAQPAQMQAVPPLRSARAVREAGAILTSNLALPSSLPVRVKDFAATITGAAHATSEYAKTSAIVDYLRTHYPYTLTPPPFAAGADVVDDFLFRVKQGFCETFATTAVVLLRSQGVPARLVTGYAPGDYNSFSQTYTVRAKDAHAWIEVYFPTLGWQAFDPTPSFDSTPNPHLTDSVHWPLADFFSHLDFSFLRPIADFIHTLSATPWFLVTLLGLVVLLSVIIGLWFVRRRRKKVILPPHITTLLDIAREKRKTAQASNERRVLDLYIHSVRQLGQRGLPAHFESDTLSEYSHTSAPRLGPGEDPRTAFRVLTTLTEQVIYSPAPIDTAQLANAEAAAQALNAAQVVETSDSGRPA